MSIVQLIETLNETDYDTIEDLAGKNFAPSDIAKTLSVSRRDFMYLWRDKTSQIREAYERGKLQIASSKEEALIDMMNDGNVTAYQIHDKKAQEQAFEDIKADVFGF
ncbi:hypothetical protein [Thalassobellus citreus]|uniref:hypothetical protein n=1 Tax=Thalassobellus citreus TaxID=3367752 RepID=UPI0037AC53E0